MTRSSHVLTHAFLFLASALGAICHDAHVVHGERENAELLLLRYSDSCVCDCVYFPSVRLSHISKFQTKARSRYELTNLIQFQN
jgi:hypothetical protein